MKRDHNTQAADGAASSSKSGVAAVDPQSTSPQFRPDGKAAQKRKARTTDSSQPETGQKPHKQAKYQRVVRPDLEIIEGAIDVEGDGTFIEQLRDARKERDQLRRLVQDGTRSQGALQERLDIAEAALKDAKRQEARMNQDLVFQITFWQDKAAAEVRIEKERLIRSRAAHKISLKKQEQMLSDERSATDLFRKQHDQLVEKYDSLINTRRFEQERHSILRDEKMELEAALEHSEELRKTFEEDFKELQRLCNEERSQRERLTWGLPPAYGSLDRDDAQTWQRHEDNGIATIAEKFNVIRGNFDVAMSVAIHAAGDCHDPLAGGTLLYESACSALLVACEGLDQARSMARLNSVDIKHDVPGYRRHITIGLLSTNAKGRPRWVEIDRPVHDFLTIKSDHTLAANKAVALLTEFAWRFLSCHQVRHYNVALCPRSIARVTLQWRDIDDILLRTLKWAFTSGAHTVGHDGRGLGEDGQERLSHMQCFLTQLREVANGLRGLLAAPYFAESIAWLAENIEVGRPFVAQHRPSYSPTERNTISPERRLSHATNVRTHR